MRELVVVLGGRCIGVLRQGHRTQFLYDSEYIGMPDSTPLSLSMPLRAEPWQQNQVMPWLNGLLPDRADVRDRWAAKFGVSAKNPFALVGQMGRDLPGAVQVAAPEEVDDVLAGRGELRAVTERQVGRRLTALRTDTDAWTVQGERWSLGGAQAKFALVERDGHWYEALGAEPTTCIVKPGVTGFLAQSMTEHVTMTAARSLGLRVATTRYMEFDGQPAIVVDRYDRTAQAGKVVRVHQEDLCQATSTPPTKKYETDGGPGVAKISDLLRNRADEDSNWRFAEAVAFNYLIGASDGHAKNYSILLSGSQVRLAPLYDVASSLPYDPTEDDSDLRKTAMAIGGQRRYGQVTARNWERFARRARLDDGRLMDRVTVLARDLPDAVASAIDELPASPAKTQLRHRFLDRLPEGLEYTRGSASGEPTTSADPPSPDRAIRVRAHQRSGRPVREFYRSLPTRRE